MSPARVNAVPKRPAFFATPEQWRAWLERHHASANELWVGLHKRASGRPSVTYAELVDGLLCFGWIDGVRKSLGADRYVMRVTPRKPRSRWSAVNLRRVKQLTRLGLMQPAGLQAFSECEANQTRAYSYEQRNTARFDPADERQFRSDAEAWKYFQSQAPWYRRTATFWVTSAKKRETQLKRLATLIECSRRGVPIGPLRRPGLDRKVAKAK